MESVFYSLFALIPIITIFILLVIVRQPAKNVMPLAYAVTAIIALLIWQVSFSVLWASTLQGLVIALEILYIIFGAIFLLNVLQESLAIYSFRSFDFPRMLLFAIFDKNRTYFIFTFV